LQNSYIRLRGYDNAVINETETITTGTYNVDWGTTNATNVRWHANVIHDYFVNTFGYYAMNYQMEEYVDQGYFVNGGADGTDIYFGSDSGEYWARSSDVIYHEYTHNVIYHIYGDWIDPYPYDWYSQAFAMDEGLADYFACTKNNDDIQGESVGVNRYLSNSYSWVSTLGPWRNGQVIGGACWDVRSEVDSTIADNLTFRALQVTPHADNFQDFLYNMLIVNENNYSGAYTDEIIDAFDNHNITVPIPSAPQNLSVTESANEYALLSWTANTEPDLKEYNIYRKGGSPFVDWTMVATSSTNSYEDLEVTTTYSHGDDFFYKVTAVDDYNLESNYSNTVEIEARLEKQMIDDEIVEEAPKVYALNSNYPNPFNPTTQISYQIPNDGFVNLTIYNSLGQEVAVLVDQQQSIGRYTVQFNANNLSSGIYFYRIASGEFNSVKKMLLVR